MSDKKNVDKDQQMSSGRAMRHPYRHANGEKKEKTPVKKSGPLVKEGTNNMSEKLQQIVESAKAGTLHPKHIHVHKDGKVFKVHSVGSKVENKIKHGMSVSSSDLDDFREFGYKVKETRKP
jgi:hypothetical protein